MEIIIRQELPEEYWETEYMTKKAFWNLHFPGCNEHYQTGAPGRVLGDGI